MSNPLVIYHAKCPDGIAAAWAAWMVYRPLGEYLPASYGDPPPEDEAVKDRDVILVDFSYPRDALVRLHGAARSLLVLDHHKTAREACEGLAFCTFDAERSGAGLAWDTLHPNTPRPWVIDYTEDRDLWRFRLPDSHAVNAWLRAQPRTLEGYDAASRVPLGVAVAEGQVLLAEQRVYIEQEKRKAVMAMVGRFGPVPVVHTGRHCASEIVGELSEGHDFAASWQERDGLIHYELRSRDGGVDVSEIARTFGGGGHVRAAGFSVPSVVHLDLSASIAGG